MQPPVDVIIPRGPDDAWVCAVALRAGITVEVGGMFKLTMVDGRHCRVFRVEDAVIRAAVGLSRAELDQRLVEIREIVDTIVGALQELYGPGGEVRW